jgi:hypothetical protein
LAKDSTFRNIAQEYENIPSICKFFNHFFSGMFPCRIRKTAAEAAALSKEALGPVRVASQFVEACCGFEPIEQIVRREIVALDRLRMAIGDLDCVARALGAY